MSYVERQNLNFASEGGAPPTPTGSATLGAPPATPKKKKKAACFADVTDEERRVSTQAGGFSGDGAPDRKTQESKQTHTQHARQRQSQRVANVHGNQISLDDFTQWTKSCGVYKIQKEYEIIAEDAMAKGVTIEEELRAHNFKNYDHFARSCDRFALNCWPGEFSELGSGFVLYYHFLVFLGVVLVLSVFAQIPAMIYYSGYDNIEAWYFHDAANKTGTVPSGLYFGQWSLTPGNLGPDAGEGAGVFLSYMVLLVVTCLLLIGEFQHQKMTEKRVEEETTSPSDFAIMVKGLPETATDEGEIKHFFSKHAVEGKVTEIVKVVIGWDADGFRDEKEKIEELEQKILVLRRKGRSEEVHELKEQVKKTKADLYASLAEKKLESSGTAVVVFRYQQDLRDCIKRWWGFWPRWLNREADDLPCLPRGNGLKFGAKLPRFPVGSKDEPPVALAVERAPNPGDVQWEKLGVSPCDRFQKMMMTNAIMLAMIFVAFWATWGAQELKEHIREKGSEEEGSDYYLLTLLSLTPGFGVAIMNILLGTVARNFGEKEYHDSVTAQEFSISFKMCIAMLINTSGVMIWTHWDPKEWYAYGGLAEDVLWVMVVDGMFAQPLGFLDIEWIGKSGARRRVTEDLCNEWTEKINQNCPPKTKENFEALDDVKQEVQASKKAFEPYEVDMAERFASAVNSFVFCFIFTPVLPILPLFGLCGVILQYWCDKWLLLRWLKRPNPQNLALARYSLKVVKKVIPAVWCVSVFIYLKPSWNDSSDFTLFFLICLSSSIFFSLVPFYLWALIVCRPCCVFEGKGKRLADESFEDYYNAQSIWSVPYHKDQFVYQGLPEEKNPKILKEGVDYTLKAADYNYQQAVEQTVETARPQNSVGGYSRVTSHGAWQNGWYGGWNSASPWNNPAQSTFYAGQGYGQPANQGGGYGVPYVRSAPQASIPNMYGNANGSAAPQGSYMAQGQANTYGQNQAFGSNPAAYGNTFGSNPAAYGYSAANAANAGPAWNQAPNTGTPQVSYGAGAYPEPYGAHAKQTTNSYQWPAATCNRPPTQSSSWVYEQNGEFQYFPWTSQSELEAKYQAFLSRQAGYVAPINIGGIVYNADFNYMTVSSPATGTQRMRRRETE